MLFWRVFLTIFGMIFGAILGLDVVAFVKWPDGVLIVPFCGALLGGTCGWVVSSLILTAVGRLKDSPPLPPVPPPRNVVRIGASLGIAEGIVVGAVYNGIMAAFLGGCIGMVLGSITAAVSWRVRSNIPLVFLALLLGFLIEVFGCLILVELIKKLANDPLEKYTFCVLFAGALLLRFLRQYRGFTYTQQDENFAPPGSLAETNAED
jgi:hypothetical protein